MAYHNNGRKYFHILSCNGKQHLWSTNGMWYDIDEKICPRHTIYATVIKANLTKHDAEQWEANESAPQREELV